MCPLVVDPRKAKAIVIEFKYRPDVDGLRAVAVSMVLLFHAGLAFPGGYVGVDVFFVISGFLITGLILKEQTSGAFSLANFWIRRIRRIIPAATVMVATVLLAGFLLLLPFDYVSLAKSAIAQQLMVSNVHFLRNTGYFDGAAELKPLLHTWSLAVEEQFYLGYPLLLVWLRRFRRRTIAILLTLLTLLSLAASHYSVVPYPSETFYLLPTRAWEMLLGGLIWFAPAPTRLHNGLLSLFSWLSLAGILVAGAVFNSNTLFPGINALLPCGSTALLIYSNSNRTTFPAAILAAKPVVFVGLISYSLYLWHWPILAFLRYWNMLDLPLIRSEALLISFALAAASWKFVESPFRKGFQHEGFAKLAATVACSALLIVCVCQAILLQEGMAWRLPQRIQAASQPMNEIWEVRTTLQDLRDGHLPCLGHSCVGDRAPDFIVWGDSHAIVLRRMFDAMAQEHGLSGVIAARTGSPPILNVSNPVRGGPLIIQWNNRVLDFVRSKKIKHVILVARWSLYIEGPKEWLITSEDSATSAPSRDHALTTFRKELGITLDTLEELGLTVWIMHQIPEQRGVPQKALVKNILLGGEIPKGVMIAEHNLRQKGAKEIIAFQANTHENVRVVEVETRFFGADGYTLIGDPGGSYYRDKDHVSEHGVTVLLRATWDPHLEEISKTANR